MADESMLLKKIKILEMQLELKNKELKILKEELILIRNSRSDKVRKSNEDCSNNNCYKFIDAYIQTSEMSSNCKCLNKYRVLSDSETQTYETDFYHLESKGSVEDWILPEGSNQTLTDLVKQTADVALSHSDYIYDDSRGMYYSISTGYYYDSNTGIFIDSQSGMKYLYCSDTQSYKFISEESKPEESDTEKQNKKVTKKRRQAKVQKLSKNIKLEKMNNKSIEEFDSNSDDENNTMKSPCEDGEILDTSCEENSSDTEELIEDEDVSKHWPPCIRVIVLESEKLQIGSLLMITYMGSVIGRDENKDLYIPDLTVSKSHADIRFNSDERCYVITDLGSQNGTYLNDFRLSEAKQTSQSYPLKHGDNLRIGACKLLLHIHEGTETCNDCEPGQVQAELLTKHPMEKHIILTKEEKERERRRNLKQIKKKFGLENMNYEDDKTSNIEMKGYEDRTKQRQKTKGSDNPYQKDDEPSSVDKSLPVDNKGYKLLQKMGWTEGEGLGKSSSGITEPISFASQTDKTGLGASPANIPTANDGRNKEKWTKTQQRYRQLFRDN